MARTQPEAIHRTRAILSNYQENPNAYDPSHYGITGGVGAEAHLGKLKVSPAVRYTHWHPAIVWRSEEHTSELQSRLHLVCRLLLEKKKMLHHVLHLSREPPADAVDHATWRYRHHKGTRFVGLTCAPSCGLCRSQVRYRALYRTPSS